MSIEEKVAISLNEILEALNKEGLAKKVNAAHKGIVVLYAYLKHLGLSDDEMSSYYNRYKAKEGENG